MRPYCIIAMLVASVAVPALSQSQTPPPADKVREYIRLYEGELARRGQREQSLTHQILEIDIGRSRPIAAPRTGGRGPR